MRTSTTVTVQAYFTHTASSDWSIVANQGSSFAINAATGALPYTETTARSFQRTGYACLSNKGY